MPWVVLQMCIRSSQAKALLYSVSSRSAWVFPLPFSTARAGRDSSTAGMEISVTLCQSVVLAASVTPWAET